ncbi:MAG: ABC transporter ATP-binding protein [Rhizobiales bacterium]|nr:ABC transporter ATP-binding protein [Hyphomicrobiales bacterium]OJY47014.1 MAG: ABC transporter ATP-binding protein [Rhizobiales bacterium 64-17]
MLLEIRDLQTSYGLSQVLFGVSLSLEPGEVITLMGRNGMGKTTTANSVTGLCKPHAGEILFEGERIDGLAPHQIARRGIGLVPEGRRIFPNLTVRENLLMAYANRRGARDPWTFERVLDFFPRLAERLTNAGNQLSGGEQQMLAIGRALMTNPALLVLDEATEGLAPLIREEIWQQLDRLKQSGLSLILIDKDLQALSRLAARHYIIEKGQIVWSGTNADLLADNTLQTRYLSV